MLKIIDLSCFFHLKKNKNYMFSLQESELEKLYILFISSLFIKSAIWTEMYLSMMQIAQISIKELTHSFKSTWTIIAKICSHLSWFTFFVLRVICLLYSRMTWGSGTVPSQTHVIQDECAHFLPWGWTFPCLTGYKLTFLLAILWFHQTWESFGKEASN